MKIKKGFYLKTIIGLFISSIILGAIWSALAQTTGPVTVDDASKCPAGWSILDSNIFEDNGTAIRAPANAHICLVKIP